MHVLHMKKFIESESQRNIFNTAWSSWRVRVDFITNFEIFQCAQQAITYCLKTTVRAAVEHTSVQSVGLGVRKDCVPIEPWPNMPTLRSSATIIPHLERGKKRRKMKRTGTQSDRTYVNPPREVYSQKTFSFKRSLTSRSQKIIEGEKHETE